VVDTIPVTARADLTDAQWAVLEPLLPKGKRPGRPPKWSKRYEATVHVAAINIWLRCLERLL
jgi:hypothetical protein